MTLKSYAQNFEDVMLWRALKHVENGFYIDVGAQHPVIDSVSLAFYEHGWRGVHVEPHASYAQLLRKSRPDETVIQAAVSDKGAILKFYEIADTGLSTCDAEMAERHRIAGFAVHETSVPCVTLASVFESCAGHEIHWLKIDVEGLEEQVLQGWKASKARPWIVVVESTLPSTQIESHDKWEKLILALDYQFVYFDGLNRYYLAKAHSELKDAFRAGPNIFDGFVLSGTSSASFCSLLNNQLAACEQELGGQALQVQNELAEARAKLLGQSEELTASQARAQWLESGWQELGAQVAQGQAEVLRLSQALAACEQELGGQALQVQNELAEARAKLLGQSEELTASQARAQWLEGEWQELGAQVAQGQAEVLRLSQALAACEQELGGQALQVQNELAEARAKLLGQSEELTASQARAQWLEGEWNAAKAKIDELNHHSHHWWTVSDGANRQLRAVYASLSWRLTMPLRKIGWLAILVKDKINAGAVMISGIPRRMARFSLRYVLAYVNNHPKIKAPAIKLLAHFPLIKAHLNAFLQANMSMTTSTNFFQHPSGVTQVTSEVAVQAVSLADSISASGFGAGIQHQLHRAVDGWRLGQRVDE